MSVVKADFPEKLEILFQPKRYKILYGGRGGAKSWGIARALLILGAQKQLRILCARELQKSIKDSVHRLLSDQVILLGLDSFYEVQTGTIRGKNGTEFFFEGLRHNAQQIKSYEGVDIAWIEEAVTVSKASWDFLIPTIRKEGSEIWISFNPELDDDETYKRFVDNPPASAAVVKLNWNDNPWFTDVLMQEMESLKVKDYPSYLNVWEGNCRETIEGAIYANELRISREEKRMTIVPYDPNFPVNTFWDLGWADMTSIWFIQRVGFQYRVLDYYQNRQQSIQHYIKVLQDRPYVYGRDYLPHDGRAKQLGTGKSIEEQMTSMGRRIVIVPRLSVADGISAARAVFSACWFDADKCSDGLQALKRYKYDVNPETNRTSKEPLHDENSHGADAWRTFAVEPNIMWDSFVDRPGIISRGGVIGQAKHDYDPLAAVGT